jgi:hypothetical protein
MTQTTTTAPPPSAFAKAPDAFARLTEDQVRETFAYTLGVQAVLWGTQWVKAGEAFRMFSRPLPEGTSPSPYDPLAHGINIWGHTRKLLNADTRLIETPNTETLYSNMVVDLADGPVVIEHPDFGNRYVRTTVWDLHSDTHTISQKQDGGHAPPYAIVPVGWEGTIPADLRTIELRSRYFQSRRTSRSTVRRTCRTSTSSRPGSRSSRSRTGAMRARP